MRINLQSTLVIAVASLMSHVAYGEHLDSQIDTSQSGRGSPVSESLIFGKADAKTEANEGTLIIKDQESESRVLRSNGRTSGRSKAEDQDRGSHAKHGARGSGSGNRAQGLDWDSYAENNVLGNGGGNAAQDLDWDEFGRNGVLGGTSHDDDEYDSEDDEDYADDDFRADDYGDEDFAEDVFELGDDENNESDDNEATGDVFEPADDVSNDNDQDESPPAIQEVTKLINRLAHLHTSKKGASQVDKLELSHMWYVIGNYYDGLYVGSSPVMWAMELPVKLAVIAHVYVDMAQQDGGYSHELDEYQPAQMATLFDISTLIRKLGEHYSSGGGQMSSINEEDGKCLQTIFHAISDFYATGDGQNFDKTGVLSVLYGALADLYDPSVQVLETAHVDDDTNAWERMFDPSNPSIPVLIGLLVIGTCIGAFCICCCVRCFRRRQRLAQEEAKKMLKYAAEISDSRTGHDQNNAAITTDPTEQVQTVAIQQLDTEDHAAEEQKVGAMGDATLEEEEFAHALSSRAIVQEAPPGSQTYEKALNPAIFKDSDRTLHTRKTLDL